jgi:hypothetical protein
MSFTEQRYLSARRWRPVAIALSIMGLLAAGTSCSSGPQPPQPGTPAFFWAASKETYRAGDFVKTSEHLQRILATGNEFSARARAWDAVISAGLAQAYSELADAWEAGARANRLNPTPFRKQVSVLRSQASASAIQFTEDVHKVMQADKDPNLLLAFAYPAGTAAPPAGLKRVAAGILVQDSERDLLQAAMLQRGVLLSVCAVIGSPDDAAAAQEKLKTGEFRVPREAFLLVVAKRLSERSELYTGAKLDLPNRLKLLSQEALKVLGAIPQSKETKAVNDKIQARLKKTRITL